ncbi:MAG: ribulose-phosphate 3-epimerase [candidate division KSB1 bacterium]|nr:ribulose-phosphate 3-epimerase [candidate division KSB1 bacterium]MDZ7274083.1 ribulose-phosphate 3-epimerase [candidate division KSB1 bacterium]MDZ7287871.1 ribulose-phosphate 3-epimerase [candidate division KSB1 bacterium]MDZ7296683.1 ribulose-phosphate 3-epimerase [candidate division KSB1 bacterium]MDZ7309425.1 ribulose-phosphate 3-epimerase [candidate division KSB1 bacterium]
MQRQIKIAPSILSADFARLGEEVKTVEAGGADLIHVDVMDGHFVPNLTIGPVIVQALRPVTRLPLDVHLMIANPDFFIDAFARAGADYFTVQVEACVHLHRTLQAIKAKKMKAGVALNPHTPLAAIEEILPDLDLVLIMSVNPGFGGQEFIPAALDKLRRLRRMLQQRELTHVAVEVDGGIKLENAREVVEAGAEILVSGSGIFKTPNPAETVRRMRTIFS